MKHIVCLYLTFLISLGAFAADSPDAKELQGSWNLVKGQLGGKPMAADVAKSITLKLDHGNYEVIVAGAPGPDQGTYKFDASASPKGMSVTGTNGPNVGKTFPAIYEIKGDTLQICYDLSGAKQPTAFESVAGTKLFLVTYKRKKE